MFDAIPSSLGMHNRCNIGMSGRYEGCLEQKVPCT